MRVTGKRSETVPPPEADLEFARNSRTGTVHVLTGHPELTLAGAPALSFAEGLAAMALNREPAVCGARLPVGPWHGDRYEVVAVFEDDAFCVRCIRALGDQSPRAFEHLRPGDEEA